jgi:chaperonin GroES
MKFRPLHDRVVVKRIDAEEKTAGGIIIPDSAKEKPSQGEITAVGPGGRDEAGKLIPIDLKVGDRVLFGKWSGTEVKLDGQELLIMKESSSSDNGAAVTQGMRIQFNRRSIIWQLKKLNSALMPATACCAASTFSPTPSR